MPGAPLIGVTTYYTEAAFGSWRRPASVVPAPYFELVAAAGGRPVLLPHLVGVPTATPTALRDPEGAGEVVARLEGLVLIGGNDVAPQTYGQEPHPATSGLDVGRDAFELALLAAALEADLPVLAICRGLQLLNVHLGGSLRQHLPDLVGHDGHRPGPGRFAEVEVATVPASRTAALFGARLTVLCSHHQSIDRLASALVPTACALEPGGHGVIEAVELPDRRFVLGVQWHPEESLDARPFAALVEAAAVLRGAPSSHPGGPDPRRAPR